MNSNNRISQSRNRTKATATIPMIGAIVTAALLLSGLSLISSYQHPAIAQQQNMTATNATGTTTGNQTATSNQTGDGATNATTGVETTTGGPMAGQGEGSGGGAAGAGGTTPSQ